MQLSKFKKVVSSTLSEVKELLINKGSEYSENNNVFHNFEKAVGRVRNSSREQVLLSYKLKHDVSIEDMVFDNNPQSEYTKEYIDEKINDTIAYMVILKAMLYSKNNNENAF
jgi:S-adenosylmethionine synthetase